ncbi:MAG TPA: polysaccharide biosynthesis tyrosine autokinase [Candidatus Polarisedimenticolia bacterium]|nr:polysaccharide biosynthesis tyrosine autokinase [Candidatus Polarisedimenticolia bacterium]
MSSNERQVHLLDYWQVLLKRRWVIYSAVLLVTGLVTLGSFLIEPRYTATVQLQIEKYSPNVLPFQDVMASYADYRDDFYETQLRLIQSRNVARSVVRELGLRRHPLFEIPPSGETLTEEELEGLVADMVRAGTEVGMIRNSRLVNVSFVSRDAELSARVANALADEFIEFNARNAYNASEQATESMARLIDNLTREIDEKERELQQYAREQDIILLDEKQNATTQTLNDLNVAFTKAQTERIGREARYAALKATPAGQMPELMTNDLLQQLTSKHAELEREYVKMTERFKPAYPPMARLKSEMEKARARLESEREDLYQRLIGQAREQYQSALNQEESLGAALDRQKKAAQELGIRGIEYNNRKIEIENKRKTLEELLKRQAETGTTAGLVENPLGNVRVVDRAEVPRAPSSPRKAFNILLSLAAGLGLGVGLAFFFDYMDDSVNTADDVTRVASLPCLGVIPAHDLESRRLSVVRSRSAAAADESRPEIDLATLRDARSQTSEAFRELRTALMVSSPGRPPRTLLVTSSQPREGKTSTALNLAITLSQLNKRVLIVDADLRRPRLHRALEMPNAAGLSTCLSGGEDLARVIVPAGPPNLHLLASGPPPPNPAELLDSEEFARLVETLSLPQGGFDHVLFDSPPVLSVADAAIMAGRVEGVILVVQAGSTSRDAVARAAEKLRVVKARVLGALLNKVDVSSQGGYYRSYYGDYGRDAAVAAEQARSERARASSRQS